MVRLSGYLPLRQLGELGHEGPVDHREQIGVGRERAAAADQMSKLGARSFSGIDDAAMTRGMVGEIDRQLRRASGCIACASRQVT